MLLEFKAVRDGRSQQTFRVEPDDPLLQAFFGRLTRPLEVTARIREQLNRMYLVRLEIEAEVEAPCRRCLTPTRQRVREAADLLFQVTLPGARSEEGAEGEEILPLRSPLDKVDIGPAVREALFLAAEPFPVCGPECNGLCPECGKDLNAESCGCAAEASNRRWQALENFRP